MKDEKQQKVDPKLAKEVQEFIKRYEKSLKKNNRNKKLYMEYLEKYKI